MKNLSALTIPSDDREKTEYRKSSACLHCGNEIPGSYEHGKEDKFCCSGCKFVYNLLYDLGLNDFYQLRDDQKLVPVSEVGGSEEFGYLDQDNFKKIYKSDDHKYCMKFYVDGISCAACLWLIEKTGDIVDEIDSVSLNMSNNVVTVSYRDDKSYSKFPETIKKFGFSSFPLSGENESEKHKHRENRNYLYRIGVAGVCAGNIMLLSAAKYSGASGYFASYFDLISLFLSIPVVIYCSSVFYKNFYYAVKNRKPSVDIPVVFVIVAGWSLSIVNYNGSGEVYFDSIALFVFLLLGSRYVLNNLRDRINRLYMPGQSLFADKKVHCWDEKLQGYEYQPLKEIKPGDQIKLKNGERLQVDGFLMSENAHLNLSVLTGESLPQYVSKGDYVYAGTILDSDDAVFRVDKIPDDSRIGKLIKNIENKNILKSGFSGMSDSYSTVFTAVVALISVISFPAFYYFYNADEAFRRIIAFVLISCPCAFVFTLPITITYSLKSALGKGLIIKDVNVLEKIKGLKNIFFDKTGTLTSGRFSVLQWDTDGIDEVDVAAVIAIEKMSGHPIARSMINYLSEKVKDLPQVSEFEYMPARGVRGVVNSNSYEILSESFDEYEEKSPQEIITKLSVYKNDSPLTTILLGDKLKLDASKVFELLRSRNISVHMISGDRRANVLHTASLLDIPVENTYWELTPEQKIEVVEKYPKSMMVGDGINDAGALSQADVGVSIQGGIEESLRLSDAYLLRNDLTSVIDLIAHSITTRNAVYRTIAFSVVYNLTAGVFALLGYINPLIAAVLMPASSLLLVLISLQMQRKLNRGPVYS